MKNFEVKIKLDTSTSEILHPGTIECSLKTNFYVFYTQVLNVSVLEVTRIFKSFGRVNLDEFGYGISDFIGCCTCHYKNAQEVEEGIFKYLEQHKVVFRAEFYNNKIVFYPIHDVELSEYEPVIRSYSLD